MVAEIKELQTEHAQIERMKRIFAAQKAAYRRQPYPTAEQRHEHIQQLKPMLLDNMDAWVEALNADFGNRSADETKLAEMLTSVEGIKYHAKHLRKWMKPSKRKVGAAQWPGKVWNTSRWAWWALSCPGTTRCTWPSARCWRRWPPATG